MSGQNGRKTPWTNQGLAITLWLPESRVPTSDTTTVVPSGDPVQQMVSQQPGGRIRGRQNICYLKDPNNVWNSLLTL